jgi:SAM-dependent methyltransferase
VTEQGVQAARPWQESGFATEWVKADTVQELLTFPRAVAAALVHQDRPQASRIIDVGSGNGEFLKVFLEEFPDASGVWTDASPEMLDIAKERLASFGDRVSYRLVDMTALAGADLPRDVDAVLTSRAAHHLDRAGLHAFYADAAEILAPGGWLINLDHIGPKDEDWNQLLRTVRKRFQAPGRESRPHHHNYPLTSVQDHHDALDAAGLTDHEMPWRGLISCLFAARKNKA